MRNSWLRSAFSTPQKGQILLIVVLVMVVALTVGLSVATRSITNLRTTTEEDNSQRAFSAAESGIEKVIKDINSSSITSPLPFGNNSNIVQVDVNKITRTDSTRLLLNDAQAVAKGEGVDVFFVGRNTDGSLNTAAPFSTTLTVQWEAQAPSDGCSSAAMEMIFLVKSGIGIDTVHQVFDACVGRGNNFAALDSYFTRISSSASNSSPTLYYQAVLPDSTNLLLVRLIPLYVPAVIAISSTNGLPTQGAKIVSTGESGETFRKIEASNLFPQVPTELYSVLFAPSGN